MHFIDDAHPAVTYGASVVEPVAVTSLTTPQWRPLRTARATVPPPTRSVARGTDVSFAHYRPGAIDRGIAAARSALRVAASPTLGAVTPRRNGPPQRTAPNRIPNVPSDGRASRATKARCRGPGWACRFQRGDGPSCTPGRGLRDAIDFYRSPQHIPATANPGTGASGHAPAATPSAGTRKAPIASAHSRSPISANVAARRPSLRQSRLIRLAAAMPRLRFPVLER